MSTTRRRQRERLAMRESILHAARDLFATQGADAVTMRAIAGIIEYSPAAIYRYFKNKDEILLELFHWGFVLMMERMSTIQGDRGTYEHLKNGCRAYVDFARENSALYNLMFCSDIVKCLNHEHGEETPPMRSLDGLRTNVRQCLERGDMAGEDVEAVTLSIWSSMHGLATLILAGRFRFLPDQDLEAMIDRMLDFTLRPKNSSES